MSSTDGSAKKNGAPIAAAEIAGALTRAPFIYADGATQVFIPGGRTTYTENGRASFGEWGVDREGKFWSFWPPAYRATYDVFWVVAADGDPAGIRFAQLGGGEAFEGRYSAR